MGADVPWILCIVHEPKQAGARTAAAIGKRPNEGPGENGMEQIDTRLFCDLDLFLELMLGERLRRHAPRLHILVHL